MRLVVLAAALLATPPVQAESVTAAVAANFKETLAALRPRFQTATGHRLFVSAGSTGLLYAQIANGAPYDVFFAADRVRPARALHEGHAVPGTAVTYAVGRLVLYSPVKDRVTGPAILHTQFRVLAMANPAIAPYGAAARQVLDGLGLWEAVSGRAAQAQNVGGAFAAVRSGAADLGFVALSSVVSPNNDKPGSYWEPPAGSYDPLRQDAVLLIHGADNPAARALLAFVLTPQARDIIEAFGYDTE